MEIPDSRWTGRDEMCKALATCRGRSARAGTIAMELLLNLPIWLIVLLGVIEVGEMLFSAQQVSLASRVGAEEASHAASLASAGEVPVRVLDVIGRQLAASGMSASKVALEHNAGKVPAVLIWGDGRGGPPRTPLPGHGQYVRVTVTARMNGLVPRLFRCVGLDFSSQLLEQSVTFPCSAQPTEIE
jgi:hypothetical protein